MKLHTKIAELVKENENKTELDNNSLASLLLYSLMQDDYFKDNYKHFTLCENDKKELYIYQPKLSSIKGFTNGYSNENVVSVYIPNEKKEIEEDYDDDDFYYEDEHNMLSDIQTIYLNDHILNQINTFVNIIEKADTIQEITEEIEKINREDKSFIHNIERYIGSKFNKQEQSASKLFQFMKKEICLEENRKNTEMCSELYYKSKDGNFFPDSFLYRDHINSNGIGSLIMHNKLKAISLLKTDNEKEKLSTYDLWTIYKDDKLGKCPDDIREMIDNNESRKKIYKTFKSKYNNALLDIALSFSKPEEKQKQIINHVMKEIKEDYINSIKEMINNRYKPFSEIKHKLELKSLNKLTEKLKNHYSEFSNSDYKVIVETTKGKSSVYSDLPLFKEITEEQNLSFFDNYNIDNYLKGSHMADDSGFNNSSQKDKVFFFAKTENELIGMLSCSVENNILNVCNISIANYRRQEGVMTNLYKTMAEYAKANNKVICTSMYTDEGKAYIPSVKEKIMQNDKNVLFLSFCGKGLSKVEREIKSINESLIRYLPRIDNLNIAKFRKCYDKRIKEFTEQYSNIENDYIKIYDLREKTLVKLNEDLKLCIDKKIKRKI